MDNFILSEEQRKELTSISDDINDYTIAKYYTLSEEDINYALSHRRNVNKIGFCHSTMLSKISRMDFYGCKEHSS